jgi:hypothetical protein
LTPKSSTPAKVLPELDYKCCTTFSKVVGWMSESSEPQSDKLGLSRQGKKGMRGRPIYYDEVKQKKHFMLTPTAIEILEELAAKQALSNSEALEQLLRTVGGKLTHS